jgi:hypothetical protein
MRDQCGPRPRLDARLDVVKVIADHQHFGRREIPRRADMQEAMRVRFVRRILTGHDEIETQPAAFQHHAHRRP